MNVVWTLVYVILQGQEVHAVNAYGPGFTFPDMYECFAAREMLSVDLGMTEGYFPHGSQAVCIPQEQTQT